MTVCDVSLLPCVADCCMLYTVCKVERFVLTILKADYYYYLRLIGKRRRPTDNWGRVVWWLHRHRWHYFCTCILVLYIVLLSISLPTVVFGNTGQVSYYFPAINCHRQTSASCHLTTCLTDINSPRSKCNARPQSRSAIVACNNNNNNNKLLLFQYRQTTQPTGCHPGQQR